MSNRSGGRTIVVSFPYASYAKESILHVIDHKVIICITVTNNQHFFIPLLAITVLCRSKSKTEILVATVGKMLYVPTVIVVVPLILCKQIVMIIMTQRIILENMF